MENKILLEIVTPERALIKEWVDEVTAPGTEGEFGVLPGHTPFLTTETQRHREKKNKN